LTKRHAIALLPILLTGLVLAACGPSEAETSAAVLTQAAQIFADSLTQTAAAASPTPTATPETPTATSTPELPTATPSVTGTPPTNTPKPTQQQSSGGGSSLGCLRAELTWETPQDGAKYEVGVPFTKTWVFKNIGTCTWNSFYSVVFIDGEQMDADNVESFEDVAVDMPAKGILPGEHVTLKVVMSAPNEQGSYKGYWMLRSDGGTLFGLGPKGTEWFWVEIWAED